MTDEPDRPAPVKASDLFPSPAIDGDPLEFNRNDGWGVRRRRRWRRLFDGYWSHSWGPVDEGGERRWHAHIALCELTRPRVTWTDDDDRVRVGVELGTPLEQPAVRLDVTVGVPPWLCRLIGQHPHR
jgi:hypothetical protein